MEMENDDGLVIYYTSPRHKLVVSHFGLTLPSRSTG